MMWQPPLYSSGQAAFGTDEGRIVSADFSNGGGQFAGFAAGEQITIIVEAEYKSTVQSPHLSILLQDRRMLLIGGQSLELIGTPRVDGMVRARAQCSFPARFSGGRYFITLRLEDRKSEDLFFPLDKQTGLMSFEVLQPRKEFLGAVDLDIRWLEVPIT